MPIAADLADVIAFRSAGACPPPCLLAGLAGVFDFALAFALAFVPGLT
jgi:hypothetical protein